jgi:hypothetical protein
LGYKQIPKQFSSSPVWSSEKGRCYKKNLSVETYPTYPVVKLVTTSLIAWHEVETTRTLGGPFPEVVMKGKKERRKTYNKSFTGPPTLGIVLP